MRRIKDLLSQYTRLTPPNASVRSEVSKAIQRVCGVRVTPKQITYRNGVARLDVSPAIRSTIFTQKEAILRDVQDSVNTTLSDIR